MKQQALFEDSPYEGGEAYSLWSKFHKSSLLPVRDLRQCVTSCLSFSNSGRLTLDGRFSMHDTVESLNPAVECSSLLILEENVSSKYSVTPIQARYILRRAESRGWKIPEPTLTLLLQLSTQDIPETQTA